MPYAIACVHNHPDQTHRARQPSPAISPLLFCSFKALVLLLFHHSTILLLLQLTAKTTAFSFGGFMILRRGRSTVTPSAFLHRGNNVRHHPRLLSRTLSARHNEQVTGMLGSARMATRAMNTTTAAPATSVDTIVESLQETARQLVKQQQQSTTNDCGCFVTMAIAGGGGQAISALAATPGASSLFLEGSILYNRNSFRSYLGGADLVPSSYSSLEAADLLSRAALRRSLQYKGREGSKGLSKSYGQCVGVGCTSALRSTAPKKGGSRGALVVTKGDGTQLRVSLQISPPLDSLEDTQPQRTRLEEDAVVSQAILQSIQQMIMTGEEATKIEPGRQPRFELGEDILVDASFQSTTTNGTSASDPVQAGAQQILNGDVKAVLLLPHPSEKNEFMAIPEPMIPLHSLVFPGSFNPPHVGHATLATVACRKTNWTTSKDNDELITRTPVFFELSITNPDKPPMDPVDLSRRVYKFFDLADAGQLPSDWGILLTSAPLFAEKLLILQPYLQQQQEYAGQLSSSHDPPLGFVIGVDTMIRILNPKYYQNSEAIMLELVRDMARWTKFVVGGRVDQQKKDMSSDHPVFIGGAEELDPMPRDVKSIFVLLKEEDFRVDISSSEIRNAATGKDDDEKE